VTTWTASRDSTHLQIAQVQLRLGINGFLETDLQNVVLPTKDRYEAQYPLPATRRARVVHLIHESPGAGQPFQRLATYVQWSDGGRMRLRAVET
jgi:hypothetical protein